MEGRDLNREWSRDAAPRSSKETFVRCDDRMPQMDEVHCRSGENEAVESGERKDIWRGGWRHKQTNSGKRFRKGGRGYYFTSDTWMFPFSRCNLSRYFYLGNVQHDRYVASWKERRVTM
jgi:hypothetical protein